MSDEMNETPREPETVEPAAPAAPVEPVGEPAPSSIAVMLGLLTSPAETFRKIDGKGGWACLAPFIILIVFGMVSGMVFTHRVNMEEFIRQQMLKGPHASEMSEAQIDQGVQMGTKFAKMATYAGFVMITIKYLLVAVVLWLVVLAFGDTITFPDTFRVVCWSQLPNILFTILAIVVLFVRDPMTLDPKNLVMSNLGAILGEERLGKAGYAFFSDLDVFTLWLLWLYTRGLAAFAKAKVGKMAAVTFGLFAILVLGHTAFAAIF